MDQGLVVNDLTVSRENKEVLTSFSLSVAPGELVALGGPNGSGKSTLALTLLGHPECVVVKGEITLQGESLLSLSPHERARRGLFLSHQEPAKMSGVSIAEALRASCEALQGEAFTVPKFYEHLRAGLRRLELPDDFARRSLNDQLSGGEKKRGELLALLLARPAIAVLDELDSGMDTAARNLVQGVVDELRASGVGFLLISHNDQFVHDMKPTRRLELK